MTIETKLETIDQIAIGVRISFLAVRNNIGIVIRLSESPLVPISSDNRRSTVLSNLLLIVLLLCLHFHYWHSTCPSDDIKSLIPFGHEMIVLIWFYCTFH